MMVPISHLLLLLAPPPQSNSSLTDGRVSIFNDKNFDSTQISTIEDFFQ
jgi:hypothetical protein